MHHAPSPSHLSRIACALVVACAGVTHAQQIDVVSSEGAPLSGGPTFGNVVSYDYLTVLASGAVGFAVETDALFPTASSLLVFDGGVVQKESDAVPGTVSTFFLDGFRGSFDATGGSVYVARLNGPPNTANSGLFWNGARLLLEDFPVVATGHGAGSTYGDFDRAYFGAPDTFVVTGFVKDPTTAATVENYVSLLSVTPPATVVGETLLARSGQVLPGQAQAIEFVSQHKFGMAANSAGEVLFGVKLAGATLSTDAVVYRWTGSALQVVANEGQPSGIPGRTWFSLNSASVALNDAGDVAMLGILSGSSTDSELLVKNGVKVLQRGDLIPALGVTISSFQSTQLTVTDAGEVISHANLNGPTATNRAIFANQTPLVQKGVSMVGSQVIEELDGALQGVSASRDGRFIVFAGRVGGVRRLLVYDRTASSISFCAGDGSGTACPCANDGVAGHGCGNSVDAAGALLTTTGTPSVTNSDLVLHGSQMGNSTCLYFQGTSELGGGAGVVFGDGLRCVGGTLIRLGPKTNVGGVSAYPSGGDLSVAAKGLIPAGGGVFRTYQCWYRDSATFCSPLFYNLTNGVRVTWIP